MTGKPPIAGSPRPEHGLEAAFRIRRNGDFTLDVSLKIEPGTTVALLGPNGAGKSTTVEVLAGLLAIEQGAIQLGGTTLDDPASGLFVPPAQRGIGIVFQDYLLFEHLTVLDNIAFGPRSKGLGRHVAATMAERWVEPLGLVGLEERRPSELSGGQAQRVAVARALACEPRLLLLDEPLAALDISTRADLRRLLVDHLAAFSGPRLLITHEPSDAFIMADFIYVLERGAVSQAGTAEEIRRRPATPYVAALTGLNFLTGRNDGGAIDLDRSGFSLQTADSGSGPVQVLIHPRAISLHLERPKGSPRNTWQTTIEWIEPLGETTRIRLAAPLPIMVDITPSAAAALDLRPGSMIWAAVKATEVATKPI